MDSGAVPIKRTTNYVLSVIIPAHNAATTLPYCLNAIQSQVTQGIEIIVVNDGSIDGTEQIASATPGVRVINTRARSGPAAARNAGAAEAQGEILLFIDSDVVAGPDALQRVLSILKQDSEIVALFGSYDLSPFCPNFLSQYKNLLHHYVHQTSSENAVTFWAGCGAIRKEIFLAMEGFDAEQYPHASIEDIELGVRLKQKGYSIRLDKGLQVKHLKRWNVANLLATDILRRAYPWSRLIATAQGLPDDLNLKLSQRWSAVLVAIGLLLLFASMTAQTVFKMIALSLALLLCGTVLYLNRHLYLFFIEQRGWTFAILVIPWHLFYYFYSGTTFLGVWISERIKKPFHQT